MAVLAIASAAPSAQAKKSESTLQPDPLSTLPGDPLLNHSDHGDMGWQQPVMPGVLSGSHRNTAA